MLVSMAPYTACMDAVKRAYRGKVAMLAAVPSPKTFMSCEVLSVVSSAFDRPDLFAEIVLMMFELSLSTDRAASCPMRFAKVPMANAAGFAEEHAATLPLLLHRVIHPK